MTKYKIEHDRENCIGCGACCSVAPDFWEMKDDGKSHLKESQPKQEGKTIREIDEKDFPINKEAADSCPVNVIHIKKSDDEEI